MGENIGGITKGKNPESISGTRAIAGRKEGRRRYKGGEQGKRIPGISSSGHLMEGTIGKPEWEVKKKSQVGRTMEWKGLPLSKSPVGTVRARRGGSNLYRMGMRLDKGVGCAQFGRSCGKTGFFEEAIQKTPTKANWAVERRFLKKGIDIIGQEGRSWTRSREDGVPAQNRGKSEEEGWKREKPGGRLFTLWGKKYPESRRTYRMQVNFASSH